MTHLTGTGKTIMHYSRKILRSLSIVLLLTLSQPSIADIPAIERDALQTLFTSTAGEQWHNNSGWLDASISACEWYGVSCDISNSTVTDLQLDANNLRGKLPASIVNLSNLNTISLEYNALHNDSEIVNDFINARSLTNYTHTQTLDSRVISFLSPSPDSIQINWETVGFTNYEGGYRIYMAEQIDSVNESQLSDFVKLAEDITGKTSTTFTLTELVPCRQYFFKIVSYTDAHDNNPHQIESDGASGNMAGTMPGFDSSCTLIGSPYNDTFIFTTNTNESSLYIKLSQSGEREYTLSNLTEIIEAGDGSNTLILPPGAELNASITGNHINISAQNDLLLNGSITANTLNITANNNITISNGSEIIDASCNITNESTISSSDSVAVTTTCPNTVGNLTNINFNLVDSSLISPVSVTDISFLIDPDTIVTDLSLFNGIQLTAKDGNSCLVTENECIADDGRVYILKDGELVEEQTGNGSFAPASLLFLMVYFGLLIHRLRRHQ